MKLYYLVYQLTNTVNGKIYVGCHMTKDMNDGYMGSGKRLTYAKKKYGVESFKKEILKICETPEEMLAEEAKIVDEAFLQRKDVYNLTCGGRGSWFFINHSSNTKVWKSKGGSITGRANLSKTRRHLDLSGLTKQVWSNHRNVFLAGLKKARESAWSEEAAARRKNSLRGLQAGTKNSQFGTTWIFSLTQKRSIKVSCSEVSDYLNNGWSKGRKIKW